MLLREGNLLPERDNAVARCRPPCGAVKAAAEYKLSKEPASGESEPLRARSAERWRANGAAVDVETSGGECAPKAR